PQAAQTAMQQVLSRLEPPILSRAEPNDLNCLAPAAASLAAAATCRAQDPRVAKPLESQRVEQMASQHCR
ncbi:MAG: hypothetical protein ACPIOQ_42825, partial [Promethearchaeia archaeon]